MSQSALRIHHIIPSSKANGPGLRTVVWVQGCSLACPGCFNPETHSTQNGEWIDSAELARQIITLQDKIEGVTISGGEPFQQSRALALLLQTIREHSDLSIIVFTGYRREELEKIRYAADALVFIDVLIAGRFLEQKRIAKSLVGSTNKEVLFLTNRYRNSDLTNTPVSEVLINPDGEIQFTGIDPISWQKTSTDPKN